MRIGLTASAFDLLHSGHVAMLQEAKGVCDYLIAALHVDPSLERSTKNRPIQSIIERYTQLSAIKYVDEIIPYETENDLLDILQLHRIDVRIIGEEYRTKPFTGKGMKIAVHYNARRHDFSSSELRRRIKESSS